MKPKSNKVEEPTAPYGAKPVGSDRAVAAKVTSPDAAAKDAAFRKAAAKIFTERKELLRKLAQ